MAKTELKPGKWFFIGGGFCDPSNTVKVVCDNTEAHHEEADIRVSLHGTDAPETCESFFIQSPETEVTVISLHLLSSLLCKL